MIDAVDVHGGSVATAGRRSIGFDQNRIVGARTRASPTLPPMTESIWFTDSLVRVHITPEQTDGAFALVEMLCPAGHITPPHIHENDDEGFLLLEGEITVHFADGPMVVRPGQSGYIPAGAPHTLCVTSQGPARAVLVSSPAGFVEFVRATGRPAEREALPVLDGPPDVALLMREAPRHGMTLLGPPGMLPAQALARA
jgi:mannose-6-phosphate isomerase-like protein (cupin superfamily)